jgi:hypothetical protein
MKRDMRMNMGESNTSDQVRVLEQRLQHMHALQTRLREASQREVAAQKEADARAQELMVRDPRGHIQIMKLEQEHMQLVLQMPRTLLKSEAQVYSELQNTQEAARAMMPDSGGMMMGHMVAMASWSQIPLLPLGLWLIASPFTLGYNGGALMWSDVSAGLLVMALAAIAFRSEDAWPAWANTFVGLWLVFAPLLFWTASPAAYANDTLVGTLVITFAILIPMMMRMPGPEVPLGWSYNPSSWLQRAPVLALALFSFLLARYMAAFQLGHIAGAWDPVFGNGTILVLTSKVSKSFPVADSGLGAFIYLIELLSGFMGDPRRWRTMPWMVSLFGFLVVPLGIVSVVLVILQPVAVGAWCTFCLLSALFMLLMVALSVDEVIAMIQFLVQTRQNGKSVWRAFWLGGNTLADQFAPRRAGKTQLRKMFFGMTAPWNLLVTAALGGWLMAAPSVFQIHGRGAHNDQILGALVVSVTIIAFAEVTRISRFINVALALTIIFLPWLLGGGTLASRLDDLIAGVLIIMLSIPPGKIRNTYGSWNPLIV